MSLRQVENKTKITYSTIKNLLDGKVPAAQHVLRFANAFHVSPKEALRVAGYTDLVDLVVDMTNEETNELTYEPDIDNYPQLQAFYTGMAPDDQDELIVIARMKWEKARKAETTHGKKAE